MVLSTQYADIDLSQFGPDNPLPSPYIEQQEGIVEYVNGEKIKSFGGRHFLWDGVQWVELTEEEYLAITRKATIETLAKKFSEVIGEGVPENWSKFTPEYHLEFANRLIEFRGKVDLSYNSRLRGGEGQLFQTPLNQNLVLKRWFENRVNDMPASIRLLKEAKDFIEANPDLSELIDVVGVEEVGSDWVVREFDAESIPIKVAVSDSIVSDVKLRTIELLSNQKGEIPANILKKLKKNSANLHYAPSRQKILIIDMQ